MQSQTHKRNRAAIIVAAAAVLLSAALLVVALEKVRQTVQCRNKLRALASQITWYRAEHDGHYPTNIFTIATYRSVPLNASETNQKIALLLTCPATSTSTFNPTGATGEVDYVYIDWEAILGTNEIPAKYPLIYDKKMRHHLGLGVNVLTTDDRFWDFRGRWLRAFAAKHPEYKLPLPD